MALQYFIESFAVGIIRIVDVLQALLKVLGGALCLLEFGQRYGLVRGRWQTLAWRRYAKPGASVRDMSSAFAFVRRSIASWTLSRVLSKVPSFSSFPRAWWRLAMVAMTCRNDG